MIKMRNTNIILVEKPQKRRFGSRKGVLVANTKTDSR